MKTPFHLKLRLLILSIPYNRYYSKLLSSALLDSLQIFGIALTLDGSNAPFRGSRSQIWKSLENEPTSSWRKTLFLNRQLDTSIESSLFLGKISHRLFFDWKGDFHFMWGNISCVAAPSVLVFYRSPTTHDIMLGCGAVGAEQRFQRCSLTYLCELTFDMIYLPRNRVIVNTNYFHSLLP